MKQRLIGETNASRTFYVTKGNFEVDTRVTGSNGEYRANISEAWKVWGPFGGYVAAIALRAAGAEATIRRPATFAAHFLSVAAFEPVDIHVKVLKRGKLSESIGVSMRQNARPVLEALVRTARMQEGLQHDTADMPDVPSFSDLRASHELFGDISDRMPFWANVEERSVDQEAWKEGRDPRAPHLQAWYRLYRTPNTRDPFLDAARALMWIDISIWPAACRRHPNNKEFLAPNLDLAAWFHRPAHESEWMYCDAETPVAESGLISGISRVWSQTGNLVASGGAQLMPLAADGMM